MTASRIALGEEFLGFLRGDRVRVWQARGDGRVLGAHPNAKAFVEAPKPIPTSFAREAFFARTAFKFTNASGVSRYGRFIIRPEAGTEYLSNEAAAAKAPNFLFEELPLRLAKGPVSSGSRPNGRTWR